MATKPRPVRRKTRKETPPNRITDDMDVDPIERMDPPPPNSTARTRWIERLTPLLKQTGHWYRIRTMESLEQAQSARQNLSSRKVLIPEPNHNWSFAARGCEVFAVYRGPKIGKRK